MQQTTAGQTQTHIKKNTASIDSSNGPQRILFNTYIYIKLFNIDFPSKSISQEILRPALSQFPEKSRRFSKSCPTQDLILRPLRPRLTSLLNK